MVILIVLIIILIIIINIIIIITIKQNNTINKQRLENEEKIHAIIKMICVTTATIIRKCKNRNEIRPEEKPSHC